MPIRIQFSISSQRRTPFACLSLLWCLSNTCTQSFVLLPKNAGFKQRVVFGSVWGAKRSPQNSDFVDAEFERADDKAIPQQNGAAITSSKQDARHKLSTVHTKIDKDSSTDSSQSLFDWSLDADPQWKEARIPFVDSHQGTVIDAKLAFVVEYDGVSYGIATPCDHVAAIAVEESDGTVTNLYPDDADNEEILEIMATQLVEHVGADLTLKKTPRVLTIQGNLDNYTKNWQEELLPATNSLEEFLKVEDGEEEEEELKFFHDFMKRELGEEEYARTMAEPADPESIGDEILELFDIPGLGDRADDQVGVDAMFQEILSQVNPQEALQKDFEEIVGHEGAALKLISYHFPKGKAYSLVQLLKPYTLVGRLKPDAGPGIEFELLTPEEAKIVIPKLEELCQQDLIDAGLSSSLAP